MLTTPAVSPPNGSHLLTHTIGFPMLDERLTRAAKDVHICVAQGMHIILHDYMARLSDERSS